jgi:alcohol dehydrogenase (NADP+)
VPKTAQKNRMAENLSLFTLSEEHMERINMLASKYGEVRYLDPRYHIGFDVFDENIDQPM